MKKLIAAHILFLCLIRSPMLKQISSRSRQFPSTDTLDLLTSSGSVDYLPTFAKDGLDFENFNSISMLPDVSKFWSYTNAGYAGITPGYFWTLILDTWGRTGPSSFQSSGSSGILSDITGSNGLTTADIEAIQSSYKEDELLSSSSANSYNHHNYFHHQPQTVELPSCSFDSYKENYKFGLPARHHLSSQLEEQTTCDAKLSFDKSLSVDLLEPSLKENVLLFDIDNLLATNESSIEPQGPAQTRNEFQNEFGSELLLNNSAPEVDNFDWSFDLFEEDDSFKFGEDQHASMSTHTFIGPRDEIDSFDLSEIGFDTLERIEPVQGTDDHLYRRNSEESFDMDLSLQQTTTTQPTANTNFYLTNHAIATTHHQYPLEYNHHHIDSGSNPTHANAIIRHNTATKTTTTHQQPTSATEARSVKPDQPEDRNHRATTTTSTTLENSPEDIQPILPFSPLIHANSVPLGTTNNVTCSNHSYPKKWSDDESLLSPAQKLSPEPLLVKLESEVEFKTEESNEKREGVKSRNREAKKTTTTANSSRSREGPTTAENRIREEDVLSVLATRGVTREHIVNCLLDDFHRIVAVLRTEEHRQTVKEIRKRGRNKLAAKRVRSKTSTKLDETRSNIEELKARREELLQRRQKLLEKLNRQKQINKDLLSQMRSK